MFDLAGLFAAAFLSATLLPGSSEAAFAALLGSGRISLAEALAQAGSGGPVRVALLARGDGWWAPFLDGLLEKQKALFQPQPIAAIETEIDRHYGEQLDEIEVTAEELLQIGMGGQIKAIGLSRLNFKVSVV
jgi:hypothetical protein